MTWTKLYTDLRAGWVAERGPGPNGRTGATLPRMRSTDGLLALSIVMDDFLRALRLAGSGQDRATVGVSDADAATRYTSSSVSTGGVLGSAGQRTYVPPDQWTVPLVEWIGRGKPTSDAAVRSLTWGIGPLSYSLPYHYTALQLEEIRFLMGAWNAVMVRVVAELSTAATQPILADEEIVAFWSAYYSLLRAIETVVELPHPSTWDRVKGGLKESLRATATFVGEATAEVATIVGETAGIAAGGLARGFLDQAGMTAFIVVAAAAYVYLR